METSTILQEKSSKHLIKYFVHDEASAEEIYAYLDPLDHARLSQNDYMFDVSPRGIIIE